MIWSSLAHPERHPPPTYPQPLPIPRTSTAQLTPPLPPQGTPRLPRHPTLPHRLHHGPRIRRHHPLGRVLGPRLCRRRRGGRALYRLLVHLPAPPPPPLPSRLTSKKKSNTCFYCKAGFSARCAHSLLFGSPDLDGGQAEYVRVPFADGTLMRAPDASVLADRRTLVLTADIFPTGYYGARNAFESLVGFLFLSLFLSFLLGGTRSMGHTSLELFLIFSCSFWWCFVSGGSRDKKTPPTCPTNPLPLSLSVTPPPACLRW